jgi:hypothetical protein
VQRLTIAACLSKVRPFEGRRPFGRYVDLRHAREPGFYPTEPPSKFDSKTIETSRANALHTVQPRDHPEWTFNLQIGRISGA